uniref:Uncharacterized protein n=1 Tax=Compsopogon caeruleus TaxID=31354 RepID=A0A7S1XDI5_9RHOD|mmetsp:Transcript_14536/g.29693  ORF Transcript_14536/g.29693 Transcript_14536/m.29693 type:complete len:174 (+) Transcript_14536:107-628(+)|eukprot:CAMPEP_0184683612 /NCGR_PEP_ID=MMETSP0312-20130426/11979_1 /TAXON_ID=31354 /ORGANISM="Compsopogon coeruleus, Strain SAG 36.94" /LENGTH=173 /DNA_ID=CAMNT_0027136077 /DNA_START=59 /DNA_END=580 /DNA_ORIENTATION=-
MAKSIRSKVKRAFRAQRRRIMAPVIAAKDMRRARRLHAAAGFTQSRLVVEEASPPMHGGTEVVSNFVPTPRGPSLNVVHGPLAGRKEESDAEDEAAMDKDPVEMDVSVMEMERDGKEEVKAVNEKEQRAVEEDGLALAYSAVPLRTRKKRPNQVAYRPRTKRHPQNKRRALYW